MYCVLLRDNFIAIEVLCNGATLRYITQKVGQLLAGRKIILLNCSADHAILTVHLKDMSRQERKGSRKTKSKRSLFSTHK